MAPSPSIQVFSDSLFLDELYRRLVNKSIRLDVALTGEGWVKLNVVTTGREPASFEAMAYPPPVAHL